MLDLHNDIFLTDNVGHNRLKFSQIYTPHKNESLVTPLAVLFMACLCIGISSGKPSVAMFYGLIANSSGETVSDPTNNRVPPRPRWVMSSCVRADRRMMPVGSIYRHDDQHFSDTVKWRHISMVAIRSPFCRSICRTVRVVKWWRFIALFE